MSKARVLVIDDDHGVRELIISALTRAGYEVEHAGDGKEGMLAMTEADFGLVITYMVMPEQEGMETIREARRRFPEIRILAISGVFDADYSPLDQALHLGADAILPKPFEPDDLIQTVRKLLGSGG